jgi:hypothetical protein
MNPSTVLTTGSTSTIQNFLIERLPENVRFSRQNIKITELWYDWMSYREKDSYRSDSCEWTRKITIERSTMSKLKEDFYAFFSFVVDVESLTQHYKANKKDKKNLERAIQKIFDEDKCLDENEELINKLYYSCKKVVFYVSLSDENHFHGPIFSDHKGIAVAQSSGEILKTLINAAAFVAMPVLGAMAYSGQCMIL